MLEMPAMRGLPLCVLWFVAGCDMGPAEPAKKEPAPVAAAGAAAAPAALKLGEPITATTTVALSDVAKSPAAFKGKTIATTGTVTSVCQERGCWMAIQDADGNATVR